jgi:hypothetical protein
MSSSPPTSTRKLGMRYENIVLTQIAERILQLVHKLDKIRIHEASLSKVPLWYDVRYETRDSDF